MPRSWRAPVSCWPPLALPASARRTGRTTPTSGSALTFSVGFGGLGYGMVVWGKYLMPRGPFSESRHNLAPTSAPARGVRPGFRESREGGSRAPGLPRQDPRPRVRDSGRRARDAVHPFARSASGQGLRQTAWRRGSYLVDITGRKIKTGDLEVGGFTTVFPETDIGGAYSQTMLIRVDPAPASGYLTPPAAIRQAAGDLGTTGLYRILQGLHARRLSRGPLPGAHEEDAVPLPPVLVRRHRCCHSHLRAGAATAASAAVVHRRRGLLPCPGRVRRARWSRVLGAGQ